MPETDQTCAIQPAGATSVHITAKSYTGFIDEGFITPSPNVK